MRPVGSSAEYVAVGETPSVTVGPPRALTLTAAATPLTLPAGTPVTVTATPDGGTAPWEYRCWRYSQATGLWTLLRDYAPTPVCIWTPGLGEQGPSDFQVWVRTVGSAASYEAYANTATVTVGPPHPLALTAAATPASAAVGMPVTVTATPDGGVPPFEYRVWRYHQGTGLWTLVCEYGPAPTCPWTPGLEDEGPSDFQVWVRTIGSTASYEAYANTATVPIGPARPLTLTATAGPAAVPWGEPVTVTAAADGGTGPVVYAVWRGRAGSGDWTLVRGEAAASTVTWVPGPSDAGVWGFRVTARPVGGGPETTVVTTTGAVSVAGEVQYVHLDALGSVRAVTDATGVVLRRHDFLPFGEEWQPQTPPPDVRLFTGKERDGDTGLDYFGARYYFAGIGRFTTPDVPGVDQYLAYPQSWNRYAYVRNAPLTFIDPTGLQGQSPAPKPEPPSRSEPTFKSKAVGCEQRPWEEVCQETPKQLWFPSLSMLAPSSGRSGSLGSRTGALLRDVLTKPWVVNVIVPVWPVPAIIGTGPAFTFAYNPITHTICGGAGLGLSAGKTLSIGPLMFGHSYTNTAWPANADSVLSGWSVSLGANVVGGAGGQMIVNSAGVAIGPSGAVPGVSIAATASACGALF
jgi:RHS repeat-associated protein